MGEFKGLIFGGMLAVILSAPAEGIDQDVISQPEEDEANPGNRERYDVPQEAKESPWYSPSFLKGWTITAGPSFKELLLDYTRSGSENIAGSMTEGLYTTYFIRVGSPYWLTKSKRWGWNIEWDYSDFHMTKQNVGTEEMDLGTEVYGYTWYISPMGLLLFGAVPEGNPEFSLITGISVGLGYIQATGDMLLTEDGSNEYIEIEESGFGINASILLEVHYWNLMSRLQFGGSVLGSDRATYDAFEMVWDFGYTLRF